VGESPAEIFDRAPDATSFRREIRRLEGDFPFDAAAMIRLGETYFRRFPDRPSGRDLEEIRLGYALVRACAVEKLVRGMSPDRRDAYRELFEDAGRAAGVVAARRAAAGPEALAGDIEALAAGLAALKATVDEIPRGMIKERFMGGLSNLFNILYVLRMSAGR
jgi:hypothetical protein